MEHLSVGNQNHFISMVGGREPVADAMEVLCTVPDAMLILDAARTRTLSVNEAFARLVGLDPENPGSQKLHPLDVVHPDDHSKFQQLGDPGTAEPDQGGDLRIVTRDGVTVPVEVFARFITAGGNEGRWIYFFRPVESRKALEKALEEQIRIEKRRTVEAVKSSLRIYQLTDKVRSAPKLSTLLMDVRTEEELFRRAGEFLVSEGMNYQEAAIFLLDGQTLKLCYSSSNRSHMSYDVMKGNRYARFLLEGEQPEDYDNVQLVALRTKDKAIGVLEVVFDPRERALFMENQLIVGWNNDILETTAEILALFLENIRLYQKLRRQTVLDPLTSVYNRHYLLTHLEAEIDKSNRLGHPLSVVFTDVDGFKEVNDTYGHHNGDLIIQEIAFLLQQSLRNSDCICRYGGDEFVILFPDTDLEVAEERAEMLRKSIQNHRFRLLDPSTGHTKVVGLTISAGVATTGAGETAHHLLQGADMALYGAKRKGKNCVYRIEHLRREAEIEEPLPLRGRSVRLLDDSAEVLLPPSEESAATD